MSIPADFSFSQNNLQDYLDCPRRFELRYLLKMAWPAVRSEPVLEMERHQRLGQQFHQMIQQHQLGLAQDVVASQATELELEEWWNSYLVHSPADLPDKRYPEITLTAPFKSYRLVAKFDLLAVEPGKNLVIVDWKTNRRKIPPAVLKNRAQTRLYPFLLTLAGGYLNGGQAIDPERVEMLYWFTADPTGLVHYKYDLDQFQSDQKFFTELIHQIETQVSPFPLTTDTKQCLFCNYRSLCLRGSVAGVDSDGDTDTDENQILQDFDFDQIAEIEY